MSFQNATQQVIMESARDASTRTASEAGDGTSTATILDYSFVARTQEFCKSNPHVSPQRVVRVLESAVLKYIEPRINESAISLGLDTPDGRQQLHSVARISANGDVALADATMRCFDICGDEGNVTISESSGPSQYRVVKLEGYPMPSGFEDHCGPFYLKFVNDVGTQTCRLSDPMFLLYFGRIDDINTVAQVCDKIANSAGGVDSRGRKISPNVVVVATGFSELVLANFAAGFFTEGAMRFYPLKVPLSPLKTGVYDFILDLASLTGGTVFDPIEKPFDNFEVTDLGVGPTSFEATRWRSNIIGRADDELIMERVDQVQKQLEEVAVSELEKTLLRERIAKLTNGIAKLIVQGSSTAEVKEKRDRAEDAVCAVRAAIKHGALPGGGAMLVTLANELHALEDSNPYFSPQDTAIVRTVAAQALLEPVRTLYANVGYTPDEVDTMIQRLCELEVFDCATNEWVEPLEAGLLDSLPAVLEAIRNAVSNAGLLGTLGGTIVFPRDRELELKEASAREEWKRVCDTDPDLLPNEANKRA
jgi:chaperonin GroEL